MTGPVRFLPFVLKQVVRRRTRSALTVGGVTIAMFLYCGVQALQQGAASVTRAAAQDTTLIVYRKDRYCPFTSRMPLSHADRIARVPGVTGVVPIKVLVNNCRTSLDVVTFRGVPADEFVRVYGSEVEVISGALADWQRRTDAALVGETLARRRRLAVGDAFEAAGVTVQVAGILRSERPEYQNAAYTHLAYLQTVAGGRAGGFVTQFNVSVDGPERLDAVAAAIDAEFAHDAEPTQTRSEAAFVARAAADVLEIVAFTRWLGWGCLVAVLALVGNAIVLAVQDRVREHAVLQTLGYRASQVAGLVVAEGLLLSSAGGLAGTLGAVLLLRWQSQALSVEGHSIPILAGPGVVAAGLLVALAIGVLASLVPAWQAARRPIVECFRAV